jgi:hypothetical protein
VKARARARGVPYTRYIPELMERDVRAAFTSGTKV